MRRTGVTSSVRFFALLVVLILCFDVCHAFCAATALLGPLGAGFCASSGKMTLGGRKLGGLLGLDMVAEDKGLSGQGESHGRGRDFKLEDELQMRIMIVSLTLSPASPVRQLACQLGSDTGAKSGGERKFSEGLLSYRRRCQLQPQV